MANIKIGQKEEELILKRYKGGETATSIARRLHVDVETVTRALRRLGVPIQRGPRLKVTRDDISKMISGYRAGRSTTELAEELGVEAGTVQRHLRDSGIELRPAGFQQGEGHHNWKGGRTLTEDGYVLVLVRPDDPYYPMAQIKAAGADGSRYCLEHRLVMAKHLKRLLTEDETVHHKDDSDRSNNHISNLQLRRGNHGKGAVLKCADCGSHNIVADELAPQTSH